MKHIAILDLGSNSVRMTITRLNEDGSYRLIEEVRVMVRLSERMGVEHILKPEPVERTLQALRLFRKLMDVHHVDIVIPVATAAVRQAENSDWFLKLIEGETRMRFRIITGDEEATFDFLGVVNTLSLDNFYMIDIGGASTEIACIENRQVVGLTSIPWGAVNLTEIYDIKGKGIKKKAAAAEIMLKEELDRLSWLSSNSGIPIVGLGGTIRSVAKVDKKTKGYPLEGVHQYAIPTRLLLGYYKDWLDMSVEKKRSIPGLGKSRADILSGAVTPLKVLIDITRSEQLIVSGNGLREGLFFDYLEKSEIIPNKIVENVRLHGVENIMKIFEIDFAHAKHVQKLSLAIFDQLKTFHGLTDGWRSILYYASLLHDAGMHIDYYNHHQHGYYLLLNSAMHGFSHREKVLLALLVGMHRIDSDVKTDLKQYAGILDTEDLMNVNRIAVFLKLAEQLDRSECGVIKDIRVRAGSNVIYLLAYSDGDASLEMNAAQACEDSIAREWSFTLEIRLHHLRIDGNEK
jgi:exopolyphosphatase/guanosine-5'-triphosphate,3'-diphosphate pyrophosphatase